MVADSLTLSTFFPLICCVPLRINETAISAAVVTFAFQLASCAVIFSQPLIVTHCEVIFSNVRGQKQPQDLRRQVEGQLLPKEQAPQEG